MKKFSEKRYQFFSKRSQDFRIECIHSSQQKELRLINSSSLEIACPDTPFLIETVLHFLNKINCKPNILIHCVLQAQRNESGSLVSVASAAPGKNNESHIWISLADITEDKVREIQDCLPAHLSQLRNITGSFSDMDSALKESASHHTSEMIEWIRSNTLLLGMCSVSGSGMTAPFYGVFTSAAFRDQMQDHAAALLQGKKDWSFKDTLLSSEISPDRKIMLAYFKDASGKNERLLAFHFSRNAENLSRSSVFWTDRILKEITSHLNIYPTTWNRHAVYTFAQLIPLTVFASAEKHVLKAMIRFSADHASAADPSFETAEDARTGLLWCMACLREEDFSEAGYAQLRSLLETSGWEPVYFLRKESDIKIYLLIGLRSKDGALNRKKTADVRHLITENLTGWKSLFRRHARSALQGSEKADHIISDYLKNVTQKHELHLAPAEAFSDFQILDALNEDSHTVTVCTGKRDSVLIRIHTMRHMLLSDLLPVISSFGFRITEEITFPFKDRYTMQLSAVSTGTETDKDYLRIASCIDSALKGETETDALNSLVLSASLSLEELWFVRSLCAFLYQTDKSYSRLALYRFLSEHPAFVRNLADYYSSLPAASESSDLLSAASDSMLTVQEEYTSRKFINILKSIVRSIYIPEHRTFAHKIKSPMLENLLHPVPFAEIFVWSPYFEGVHLRTGPVSRGGIRWSDRPDDFRTEIHGLVKAQLVKNTVIVPEGSKGGFVLKSQALSEGIRKGEPLNETARRYYRIFTDSLLRLTDNLDENGNVIAAEAAFRKDPDDPYLVVAADKGTAGFSDTANEVSLARGYWLGDAFASGGKNGYDHKVQGITAKGAWESVIHHFSKLNKNPSEDPLTVIGIGDMSGDVFGNGMLLSKSILLIAAFNHRWIFIDPDPDPLKSFAERKRLFEKVQDWNFYSPDLISSGGGVFERSARKIPVSPEMKKRFEIRENTVTGDALIRYILRAKADLLWNGGIGTYIKSSSEADYAAGDPSNDSVRINADQLRVQVIAEGGNLGLTQRGRIEAALKGVRLNTDAVDNSAGVNMSDHEVNLKILLSQAMKSGIIENINKRNKIIRMAEEDVQEAVLETNRRVNLGLTLDELRTGTRIAYLRELLRDLTREKICSKEEDALPLEAELDILEKNRTAPVRPVLASLSGFTKIWAKKKLRDAGFPTEDDFADYALHYFPPLIQKKFAAFVRSHPLRREIIIMEAVNRIIDHAGITFYHLVKMRTGRDIAEITSFYLKLSDFLEMTGIMKQLSPMSPEQLLRLEEIKVSLITRNPDRIPNTGLFHSGRINDFLDFYKQFPRGENPVHHLSMLEDVLQLYIKERNSAKFSPQDYISAKTELKTEQIHAALQSIPLRSSWEEPFASRLGEKVYDLVFAFTEIRNDSAKKAAVMYSAEELLNLSASRALSLAAAHELMERMLQAAR